MAGARARPDARPGAGLAARGAHRAEARDREPGALVERHEAIELATEPPAARIARNAYRNFCTPDRRDVWAGFRTCAVEPP